MSTASGKGRLRLMRKGSSEAEARLNSVPPDELRRRANASLPKEATKTAPKMAKR